MGGIICIAGARKIFPHPVIKEEGLRIPTLNSQFVEMEKAKVTIEAAIKAEEAGDLDKARQLYEQASLLVPEDPFPRMRLAFLLLEERKLNQAIRVARQLIKRWPRFQPPYVAIAQSYARLGRWRLAERFYRQALAIEEEPNVLLFLGVVLSQLEQNDEAEECFSKSLELDPDNEETHYNLGLSLKIKGRFDNAEKHLKRAIEINPKYGFPYSVLGEILAKDRPREAIDILRKAIDHNLNDGWSMAYLADALSRSGKLKAAEKEYRRLIELWPNESMPYWAYGDFLPTKKKDRSTAEQYLRKAVEIEPTNQWANYYFGNHLIYWDRNEEARIFLTKAARLGHSRARELIQWIDAQG